YYRAEEIARAVTFRAMPGSIDEVGASIPLRALRGVRFEHASIEEKKFPGAQDAAETENRRQIMRTRFAAHRCQGLDEGEQVAHVIETHVLVGRVGKCRIIVASVGSSSLPQGTC